MVVETVEPLLKPRTMLTVSPEVRLRLVKLTAALCPPAIATEPPEIVAALPSTLARLTLTVTPPEFCTSMLQPVVLQVDAAAFIVTAGPLV